MPARLSLLFSERPRRVVILDEAEGEILLGRESDCTISVDDDRVSRRHARLVADAEGWRLDDLGSKNGTFVAGREVTSTPLAGPAWISFGGLPAHFEPISTQAREEAARLRLESWQSSVELQRQLDPEVGISELLRRLLRGSLRLSGTERGFVLLTGEDGELEVAATAGLTLQDLCDAEFSGSLGAVQRVLSESRPVVCADVSTDPELGERPSVLGGGIRALACLPLRDGERLLGALYVDGCRTSAAIDELDVEILEAVAGHAALAIAVARLDEETRALAAGVAAAAGKRRWTWSDVLQAHTAFGEIHP